MMTVQILVNGKIIDSVKIINRGPVDGVYVGDDEPGGDGERRYEWRVATSTQGKHRGEVRHFRRSGARRLAADVLTALADLADRGGDD